MRIKGAIWPSMPFLRAFLPLSAGVACYDPAFAQLVLRVLASAVLLLLALPFLPIRTRFRLRYATSFSSLTVVFCLGQFLACQQDIRNRPNWIGRFHVKAFAAVVDSEPRQGAKGSSFQLRVQMMRTDRGWFPCQGRVQAFTAKGDHKTGDTLLVFSSPVPLKTRDPGYRRYLARKNVHQSTYLHEGNHVRLTSRSGPGPLGTVRKAFLAGLDSLFPDRNEKAMALALLLGQRADMDRELLNAYTDTGVVHVIAVSGMHLALIYSMISLLLRPLARRRTRQLRTLTIMAALWTFALVCGGSPSVIRSALMFSFILWADVVRKEHQPANTLAGSAFILVCADPGVLYDIGFQLSYAAVASLMVYSGPVNRLLQPDNPLLGHAWSTIATTIAAQVLTTPLVLLYFGQFPLLFLPANLIAIPLSSIVLLLVILACILLPTGMAGIPAALAGTLIGFLNQTISGLGNTRFATVRDINIMWYDAVNIYIVIAALTLWIRSKK